MFNLQINCLQMSENNMEGAEADDGDAHFIMTVLENDIVTGTGGLSTFSSLLVDICKNPTVYKNKDLQYTAMTALLR